MTTDNENTTTAPASNAAAGSASEYREALQYCWELLGEAERDEINIRDEIEKWQRAYGYLLSPNAKDSHE